MAGPGTPHDDHHDDHADAAHEEQEEQLRPDEAPTPLWLPVAGIVLALLGLFLFLATRPAAPTAEEMRNGANGDAAGSAEAPENGH